MILRLTLLLGALLFVGFTDTPPPAKPLDPLEAAKQGRELAAEILAQSPAQNLTNVGVLKIRDAQGKRVEMGIEFAVSLTASNWLSDYSTRDADRAHFAVLSVLHSGSQPNRYLVPNGNPPPTNANTVYDLPADQIFFPFAGSDFCAADLGLEFLHWPDQKLLKSELRKTRLCRVLESLNPQPTTNAYSRVVSWIDDESRGILHAEAYDFQNKLLKEFDTKKFKKVNEEWLLEQMEIYNVQTRSRTQIEFNFDAK